MMQSQLSTSHKCYYFYKIQGGLHAHGNYKADLNPPTHQYYGNPLLDVHRLLGNLQFEASDEMTQGPKGLGSDFEVCQTADVPQTNKVRG